MNWKIGKGNELCVKCEQQLVHGDAFFSTIETGGEEIARYDYCEACFEQDPENKKKVFWRTRKTIPQQSMKKAVNFEVVREIFLKMLNVDEKLFKEVAYLLALVLIRKRFFKLKDFVSINGVDYMEMRQKKGAPLIRVEVPLLKEDDIAVLRNKLSALLDTDFDESVDVPTLRESLSKPVEEPEEEGIIEEGTSCGESGSEESSKSSTESESSADSEPPEDADHTENSESPEDANRSEDREPSEGLGSEESPTESMESEAESPLAEEGSEPAAEESEKKEDLHQA